MRIVNLVAPIGKGTRGLIVAPSKAGKTTLLEHMTKAIHAGNPGTRVIVMLIDERPEWIKPQFIVKAVRYPGNEIHATEYLTPKTFLVL